MVLERLGRALHASLQKLTKRTYVDKVAIKELVRDIQRAMLQADINVQMVLDMTKRIEKRALGEKLLPGMSRKEHIIKIVYDELSAIMGHPSRLELKPGKSTVLLMVGLQGGGKTTSAMKLASYFRNKGFKVGTICADAFRPGAYEQLRQLGEQVNIPVFGDPAEKDSIKLAKQGVKRFKNDRLDLIIVDSAGRHRREETLMKEMKRIAKAIKPDEIMLIVDGTLGQQAKGQAAAFKDATGIGSIMITKLDGTAKGGGALSSVAATGAPIKFIGVGEKIQDLEPFVPERFVSRLLGMGDLETLLRRMEEAARDEEIKPAEARAILAGKLTLRDVYEQLEMVSKMGPLDKLIQMIPGLGMSLPEEQMRVGEEKLKKFKVVMQSMTTEELENPKVLNASRVRRIARGSGTSEADVKELLKQYELMRKLIRTLVKGRGARFGPLGKLLKGLPKGAAG